MTAPIHAQTDPNSGARIYTHPGTGETAPSVTTILNCISKPLVNWAKKATAEWAYIHKEEWLNLSPVAAVEYIKRGATKEMNHNRDLGSAVHRSVEQRALGLPITFEAEFGTEVIPYVAAFDAFRADFAPDFLHVEATVWSRTHGYAGSTDGIARLRGETTALDVKTGTGIYPEHALQLAAYSRADFILMPDGSEAPLPEITAGAVLHLRPDGYRLHYVDIGDEVFDTFLAAAKLCAFQGGLAKTVLREAVALVQ